MDAVTIHHLPVPSFPLHLKGKHLQLQTHQQPTSCWRHAATHRLSAQVVSDALTSSYASQDTPPHRGWSERWREDGTLNFLSPSLGIKSDFTLRPLVHSRSRKGHHGTMAAAGAVYSDRRAVTGTGHVHKAFRSVHESIAADVKKGLVFSEAEVSEGIERQKSGGEASTSQANGFPRRNANRKPDARRRKSRQEDVGNEEASCQRRRGSNGEQDKRVRVSKKDSLKALADVHNRLLQSGRADDCAKLVQAALDEGLWSATQIDRALKGGRILFCLALPRQPRLLPAALSYIRLLPVGAKDYTCVINACARARNVDLAIEVLEIMKERGVGASFYDYSGVISTAAKAGDYHRALGLFQRARDEGVADTSLWNALLEACKESGQFQKGYEHFEAMKAAGERPNLTTFNTMASLAAKGGNLSKAVGFYRALRSSGLSPDGRTATILFSTIAANPNQVAPSSSPHALYQELTKQGVRPDSFLWSAYFNAIHAVQKPGELDSALEVYVKEVKPADAAGVLSPGDKRFVYSALLNACAKAGRVDYAFGIRNDMLSAGVPPDAYASTSLIRACGEVFQVQRALEYFDSITSEPSSPALRYGQHRRGGALAVHNALLDVLVKADEMTKAMEFLKAMQASEDCQPDLIAYNTVLMGCAYNKQMTRAFLVLKQLLKQGLVPNQRTFMPLIDVCGRVGKVDRAFSLLTEMKSRGLSPTCEIYTRLMEACSQSGVPEQAFGVFRQMMADGVLPTADSFAALLGACAARADADQAFKLWKYMWENGIEPNDTCYDYLIKVCSRAGKIEEALDVFKETVRQHNVVTVGSFNSLMLALCSDGTRSVDRACRVLSLCRSMGVDPNRRSLLILIEGLAQDGQVEPAYQFHKELMSREWNPDQKPYGRLVSALCNAGHVGRAVRVVEYMDDHGVRLPVASLGSLVAGCARTGRLPMALEMYDQVKAKAVAELTRLKQTGGFRWVTNYRNPLAKIPALAYEALIEGCCGAGLVARAVEVIGDIQDVGVVVNKATLAYLVNVASSYPEEPYMYAVQSQLRKQMQRHKELYVDQSSTLAAMYKQAHVDFQDAATCMGANVESFSDGALGNRSTAEEMAGGRETPTGYDKGRGDSWGYDREASDGYRVEINGDGEEGDLKAKQQSLKEKLKSRFPGDLRISADGYLDVSRSLRDAARSESPPRVSGSSESSKRTPGERTESERLLELERNGNSGGGQSP